MNREEYAPLSTRLKRDEVLKAMGMFQDGVFSSSDCHIDCIDVEEEI